MKNAPHQQLPLFGLSDEQLAVLAQRYRKPRRCEGDVSDCLARWRQAETDVRLLLAEVQRLRKGTV